MPRPRKTNGLTDQLRDIVRNEYAASIDYSGMARVTPVMNRVLTKHRDLVDPYLTAWGLQHFKQLIARELKAATALRTMKSAEETHLVLPGLEGALVEQLPGCITVPVEPSEAEEDPDDPFYYVPAKSATKAQWRLYLKDVLVPQLAGLGEAVSIIETLLDDGENCPEDEPLLPWLSRRNSKDAA